ncbi:hypothetical protein SLS59_007170 [Nothophoma quercina]|uniref:Mating type protein n=1 Tax=Nothophoma quercina TaxID=749835 RepID=A0ABR3R163_9PLEO
MTPGIDAATGVVHQDSPGVDIHNRALKTQATTATTLQATTKRLNTYQRKREILQKATEANTTDARAALDEYARAICRSFCEEVYDRFPREIRDMIYGYIYLEGNIDIVPEYLDAESLKQLDHWRYAEFAGSEMHQELGEHFFRLTVFEFGSNMSCLARVPKCRMLDESKIGYVPAYYTMNVQIDINCMAYDIGCFPIDPSKSKKKNFNSGWNTNNSWGTSEREGSWLEEDHIYSQEWMCNNIVPLVYPTIQRLKAAGYHVGLVLAVSEGLYPAREFCLNPVPSSTLIWKEEFQKYKVSEERRLQKEKEAEADQDDAIEGELSLEERDGSLEEEE